VDYEWPVFVAKFNETWRKKRKMLDTSLRPGAIMSYQQVMEEKTRELLVRLCADPTDFVAHIDLSVGRPYVVQLLTARKLSGKNPHVNHIRLRPEAR
jgi:hypothetical protein